MNFIAPKLDFLLILIEKINFKILKITFCVCDLLWIYHNGYLEGFECMTSTLRPCMQRGWGKPWG